MITGDEEYDDEVEIPKMEEEVKNKNLFAKKKTSAVPPVPEIDRMVVQIEDKGTWWDGTVIKIFQVTEKAEPLPLPPKDPRTSL